MNKEQATEFAKKYLADVLSFFGINAEITATTEDDVIELSVGSTELNSLLIGRNAETLRSFQYLVSTVLRNKESDIWRVSIDIADYTSFLSSIRLIVKTADWDSEGGNLLEAGLDNFRVDYNLSVSEGNMHSDFSVYPNPSNDFFYLTFGDNVPENLVANVYDVSGKLVTSSNIKKNNPTVNINKAGIYTIILVGEDYVCTPVKVVKL